VANGRRWGLRWHFLFSLLWREGARDPDKFRGVGREVPLTDALTISKAKKPHMPTKVSKSMTLEVQYVIVALKHALWDNRGNFSEHFLHHIHYW
jgi:hypothetical protein